MSPLQAHRRVADVQPDAGRPRRYESCWYVCGAEVGVVQQQVDAALAPVCLEKLVLAGHPCPEAGGPQHTLSAQARPTPGAAGEEGRTARLQCRPRQAAHVGRALQAPATLARLCQRRCSRTGSETGPHQVGQPVGEQHRRDEGERPGGPVCRRLCAPLDGHGPNTASQNAGTSAWQQPHDQRHGPATDGTDGGRFSMTSFPRHLMRTSRARVCHLVIVSAAGHQAGHSGAQCRGC